MKLTIGQVADYVGVTIRAVRHYHQRGLLPEPERDASGYRRYDATAVVDLIKIKTLADAGVPLAQIKRLLDAGQDEFASAMSRLGEALDSKIIELNEQKRRIADLAAGDTLFLPPKIADLLDRLRAIGVSPRTVQIERDGWILLAARHSQAAGDAARAGAGVREADPRSGPLHSDTWEALERVRGAGQKAIVMVNRRGFAPWLTCRSCGRHWSCPNCDVSLIVHRHSGRLVCHHCAHREPLPRVCGDCSSTTLSRRGWGRSRSRSSWPSAWRRCLSSASTRTPPALAAPTPASSLPSARRRVASSSALKWSPRDMTSRK